jgi:hypothetical protein
MPSKSLLQERFSLRLPKHPEAARNKHYYSRLPKKYSLNHSECLTKTHASPGIAVFFHCRKGGCPVKVAEHRSDSGGCLSAVTTRQFSSNL